VAGELGATVSNTSDWVDLRAIVEHGIGLSNRGRPDGGAYSPKERGMSTYEPGVSVRSSPPVRRRRSRWECRRARLRTWPRPVGRAHPDRSRRGRRV